MRDKSPRIIFFEKGEPLNEEQLRDAFRFGEHSPLWRALVQIIEVRSAWTADSARANLESNNPLGMAAAIGGEDALKELLVDLSRRRQEAMGI